MCSDLAFLCECCQADALHFQYEEKVNWMWSIIRTVSSDDSVARDKTTNQDLLLSAGGHVGTGVAVDHLQNFPSWWVAPSTALITPIVLYVNILCSPKLSPVKRNIRQASSFL